MEVPLLEQRVAQPRFGYVRSKVWKVPGRQICPKRGICCASILGLEHPGELGWSTARAELALGTLVGTGSYGIVREAEMKGLQVRTCSFLRILPKQVPGDRLKRNSRSTKKIVQTSLQLIVSDVSLTTGICQGSLPLARKTSGPAPLPFSVPSWKAYREMVYPGMARPAEADSFQF